MGKKFTTVDRSERTYTPKDWMDGDIPEQNALTFKFKPLSKKQLAEFSDSSSRMDIHSNAVILGTSAIDIKIFKVAITGWENFIVDEKPYPFKRENNLIEDEVIEILDLDIISEVADYIIMTSKFPEIDKGK